MLQACELQACGPLACVLQAPSQLQAFWRLACELPAYELQACELQAPSPLPAYELPAYELPAYELQAYGARAWGELANSLVCYPRRITSRLGQ